MQNQSSNTIYSKVLAIFAMDNYLPSYITGKFTYLHLQTIDVDIGNINYFLLSQDKNKWKNSFSGIIKMDDCFI